MKLKSRVGGPLFGSTQVESDELPEIFVVLDPRHHFDEIPARAPRGEHEDGVHQDQRD